MYIYNKSDRPKITPPPPSHLGLCLSWRRWLSVGCFFFQSQFLGKSQFVPTKKYSLANKFRWLFFLTRSNSKKIMQNSKIIIQKRVYTL